MILGETKSVVAVPSFNWLASYVEKDGQLRWTIGAVSSSILVGEAAVVRFVGVARAARERERNTSRQKG